MTTLRTTPHQTGRQAARQTGRAAGEETGQVRISSPAVEALELPPIGLKRVFSYLIACLVVVALGAVLVAKYATPPRSAAAPSSFVAAPNVAANEDATPTETEAEADPIRALRGAIGPASQVTISPVGDRVLAVRDRGVDVWRVDGAHTGWLAVDGDRVSGAAWSADGARVVVWGPEGTVRLWNAETGALVRTVQAGMGAVERVELIDDGHVMTVGADGVRRTWNLASGDVRVERGIDKAAPSKPLEVNGIETVSADGRWRAFVDAHGDVQLQRRQI
jgi:hypothetical protein